MNLFVQEYKFCLPQELCDIILLYLDYSTLENCREIQSEFIKNTTKYMYIDDAEKYGTRGNVKWSKNNNYSIHYSIYQSLKCLEEYRFVVFSDVKEEKEISQAQLDRLTGTVDKINAK